MVTPIPSKEIGTGYKISKYTLEELIEEGEFGGIEGLLYKARDQKGNIYGMKIIKEEKLELTLEKKYSYLIKEKDILPVSDYLLTMFGNTYEQDSHYFICLEYCNSGNLLRYMEDKEYKISIKEIMDISKDICMGIYTLHNSLRVHLDIRLANILIDMHPLTQCRTFKLGDLGLRQKVYSQSEIIEKGMGYIPPQIFMGEEYTNKADIWSFGVLLFQLAFQVLPFGLRDYKALVLRGECSIPNTRAVSNNYMNLLINCLQFYEKDRFNIETIMTHPFFLTPHDKISTITTFSIFK